MKLLLKLISLRFKLWLLLLCKDQQEKLIQDLPKLSTTDEPMADNAFNSGSLVEDSRLFLERVRTGVMVALFISVWVMFLVSSLDVEIRPESSPVIPPNFSPNLQPFLQPHFDPRFQPRHDI